MSAQPTANEGNQRTAVESAKHDKHTGMPPSEGVKAHEATKPHDDAKAAEAHPHSRDKRVGTPPKEGVAKASAPVGEAKARKSPERQEHHEGDAKAQPEGSKLDTAAAEAQPKVHQHAKEKHGGTPPVSDAAKVQGRTN